MTPDYINGTFEFVGAIILLLDCIRLRRDRRVLGVHWGPKFFFMAWGLWNLYYYPALGQWFSFAGGCALVMVNAIWLVQLALFTIDEKLADALLINEPIESIPPHLKEMMRRHGGGLSAAWQSEEGKQEHWVDLREATDAATAQARAACYDELMIKTMAGGARSKPATVDYSTGWEKLPCGQNIGGSFDG